VRVVINSLYTNHEGKTEPEREIVRDVPFKGRVEILGRSWRPTGL
jgi:hypothetical protein